MVGPIRPVHFALCLAFSFGDSTINSDLGSSDVKPEDSLEWGAAALNLTADLLVQTTSALNGDTPEAAATTLRELSSKLMDTSSGSPSKADAKLAQKLGANALKLGAKVLANTDVSNMAESDSSSTNEDDHHAREFVAVHENATQSPESASLEWFKSRFMREDSDVKHDKHKHSLGKVPEAHARSKAQSSNTLAPPVLPSRDLLQNALSTATNSGMFDSVGEQHGRHGHQRGSTLHDAIEDNSVATQAQTCSFTLTLSRSAGDRKKFKMQVTSGIDDAFHVQGCSRHGCDGKGFCAHQCIKQGAAGINVIKNQHGEEVGYANCCSETNDIVHTEGCTKSPLESKLASDLAHRFPGIAVPTVKAAIHRARGDVTVATEELRSLALSRARAHDHQELAPGARLRRSLLKEQSEVSHHASTSSFIDKMREQVQREQSAEEVDA